MCGIFGEFGDRLLDKKQFLELNKLSAKRGPDMEGYWSNNQYSQMGFNRLSIIDLSPKGNQPMITENERWIMVMNGEVYNFHEIRKKMGLKVSDFRSQSDADVVLTAFNNWGISKTLEILNGIFAIALLDTHSEHLHLIRDFAGVKPLYYGIKGNVLIFSSQYDQIFLHPHYNHSKEPNSESLYDYTQFGYVPAPNAFFIDTWQVEPGEIVSLDLSLKRSKKKYYKFSVSDHKLLETDIQTEEKLDAILEQAVTHQLISDVPVGTFLSGGIDSPLISYYAHKVNPKIETFTIGSEDPSLDETKSAGHFVNAMNVVNHLHYYSDKDLVQDIEEHFKAFSEPFGDYSSLPTFQVCKMAKSHFSVMLSGDGGDEIFWGYPRFHRFSSHLPWFDYSKNIRKFGATILRKLGYNISYGIHAKNISEWVINKQSHNHPDLLDNLLPGISNSNFINKLYSPIEAFDNKVSLLHWLRWNEFYGHLQRVLMKIDRSSMHHGMEVRVPFLDRNVLALSRKIHPELSINHHKPKFLLKKLMEKKYSSFSSDNKKKGFAINIDSSLKNVLKEEVCDLLIGGDPYPTNTFHLINLRKYVNDYFQNNNSNFWGIWILYSLQKWAQLHDV